MSLNQSLKIAFMFLMVSAIFAGCVSQNPRRPTDPRKIREALIKANKKNVRSESDRIDHFISQQGWDMKTSETGLRYQFLRHGTGDSAVTGDMCSIAYIARLFSGRICFEAGLREPKQFVLNQDNVPTGVHQAVEMMRVGDSARFVLPAHLAYGLTGEGHIVPPNSPLVYEIALLAVHK